MIKTSKDNRIHQNLLKGKEQERRCLQREIEASALSRDGVADLPAENVMVVPKVRIFRIFRAQQLSSAQNALAQQFKAASAIHGTFDEFQPIHLAFDRAV